MCYLLEMSGKKLLALREEGEFTTHPATFSLVLIMRTTKNKEKLIEVALPLPEINDDFSYDKMPGIRPHPRGIHRWWAGLLSTADLTRNVYARTRADRLSDAVEVIGKAIPTEERVLDGYRQVVGLEIVNATLYSNEGCVENKMVELRGIEPLTS